MLYDLYDGDNACNIVMGAGKQICNLMMLCTHLIEIEAPYQHTIHTMSRGGFSTRIIGVGGLPNLRDSHSH